MASKKQEMTVGERLSGDDVVAFYGYMKKKFGTMVIEKADAVEMRVVAASLALMGIMDVQKFLKKYATTVGNRVYVPFEVGSDEVSLVDQIALLVHEHVHVGQFEANGFVPEYLLNSGKRALHECSAYRATMEMVFYLTGRCPSPSKLAKGLKAYMCSDEDIAVADKYLNLASEVVKGSGVITEESKVAIAWLRRRMK